MTRQQLANEYRTWLLSNNRPADFVAAATDDELITGAITCSHCGKIAINEHQLLMALMGSNNLNQFIMLVQAMDDHSTRDEH